MLELGLRALLLRTRTLALALLPLVMAVVCVVLAFAVSQDKLADVYPDLGANLLVALVVALVALVLGVNAFDDERDGGTFPLLAATSTPRWRIVGARVVAAWIATVLVALPAVVGCGVLGSRAGFSAGEVWGSLLAMLVLTSGAYCALFVLLSLLTQRALLIGLGYVVVWETSFAAFVKSLRNLSIGAYGRRLVGAVWDPDQIPFKVPSVGVTGAVVVLVAVIAVGTGLAMRRLPHVDVNQSGGG
ncbi:ABC-2 type transport system permease protein [Motilibacter rhizosphaerae]|uniref:ABC-2 type transport system permease protein n=1 Tax=Motilibacter rhizosphaerae TaxID=598652 RepID=A0A4Q7NT05_9ACTN|nr:ABC transporter permease subunit [Motilibacter rhizosphaerae]RZS90237.1 ABC-2 type transport system permease protein [Motilibacter rhizosphaerae]